MVNAQSVFCPANIDFEQGNFGSWYLYSGNCCPISTPTLSGALLSRHTITSIGSNDTYGGFPIVAPNGGTHSLKLGNNGTNSQAERARYYVRVPSGLNNYSLILRYAIVLEDPSHYSWEQPRFEVRGYDSASNAALACVQFNFVASSSLPGFMLSTSGSSVWYKSWSVASLNLSGYAGRTVAIDCASGDCSLGGHFGYGYVDFSCGLFQISSTVCKGTVSSTLKAPPGFQQYRWYDSTFSTLLGTGDSIVVPTPSVSNKYKVILFPYFGYGCPDTLSTTIEVNDLKLKLIDDTAICKNSSVQFLDTATVNPKFQPLQFNWVPSAGLSCSTCLNPIASPSSTTLYKLIVTDSKGCGSSDSVKVTVGLEIVIHPVSTIKCWGSKAVLKVKVSGIRTIAYKWRKNGVEINGATTDSLVVPDISVSDTAAYDVIVFGECDSLISNAARLDIYATPKIATQPQSIVQCIGSRGVLKFKASNPTPLTYQWRKNGVNISGATKDSLVINPVSFADTGTYYVMTKAECEYVFTDTVRLSVRKVMGITAQPVSVNECRKKDVFFSVKAVGFGNFTYQWYKNGTIISGAVNDSLKILNIDYADTGTYKVWVKTTCDSLVSVNVKLNINPPSAIVTQPVNVLVCHGSKAVFRVKAAGTGVLRYQWQKNGVDIPGAISDSLYFNNLKDADTADYSVIIHDDCDGVPAGAISIPASLRLYPVPQMNLPDTSKICLTSSVLSVTGFVSYLWNTGSTSNSITVPGEGKYWVYFYDLNNCSNYDTTYVKFLLVPQVDAGNDTALCNKMDLKLNGETVNAVSTLWLPNNYGSFTSSDSLHAMFHPKTGLLGPVYLKLSSTNNCGTAIDSMKIDFTPKPSPAFTTSDSIACEGAADILFDAQQTGGAFYDNDILITSFHPLTSGLFSVKYKISLNGCTDSSSQTIRVVQKPVARFSYKPNKPSIDSNVNFISESKYARRLLWDMGNGDTSSSVNPVQYFPAEGYYRITLYAYLSFCMDSISQTIRVKGSANIWVPTAFTPNGDGQNDTFKVVYANSNGGVLYIYNRWGELVFKTDDLNMGWDGMFEGAQSPADVYFYVVDYIDNDDAMQRLRGNLTLLK